MDVGKGNITSILNGTLQFIIPVYQRPYSWRKEQYEKLWNDIVEMQRTERISHFVGSFVCIAEKNVPGQVLEYMIIDGQQRMMTLSLLFIALRDFANEKGGIERINPKQINGQHLINDYGEGNKRYKLYPTYQDRDIYFRLVEHQNIEASESSKLIATYDFFKEKLGEGEITPNQVLEGIGKLQIVNITLERGVDEPQMIFESLNSTGLDLSQSDLIRNFILMDLNPNEQNAIYKDYWMRIEKFFQYEERTQLMDKFFRDYLTFKTSHIANKYRVYEDFKDYRRKNNDNIEDFCKDIYDAAKLYSNMLYADCSDTKLNQAFRDINALKTDVAYPFLLKLYFAYEKGKINYGEFLNLLKLNESYVFRRQICGIPTNSLNKTYSIAIHQINEKDYYNSVVAYFLLLDAYKILPGDEIFIREFENKDLYSTRNCSYILAKLENFQNKAPINMENYTIEHIMPQNKKLNLKWRDMLGENWQKIQETWLHTIGNLTLTGYNPEWSDNDFEDKLNRPHGLKESALCINAYVVKQSEWTEKQMQKRAHIMSDLALKIWPSFHLDEEILDKYRSKEVKTIGLYDLNHYESLVGDIEKLYKALDSLIMNLGPLVHRDYKKMYIAYKVETNFCDVVPKKGSLELSLNIPYDDIIDPLQICIDFSDKGHWGNGDVEIILSDTGQIENVMALIEQSYNRQIEE